MQQLEDDNQFNFLNSTKNFIKKKMLTLKFESTEINKGEVA